MLNGSELVDFVSYAHPDGIDLYYLVKNPIWRSSDDAAQGPNSIEMFWLEFQLEKRLDFLF